MTGFPMYVRVDSETFGDDCLGVVQSYEHGLLKVRLDLEDEHPAMRDAVADGHDPAQAEFIEYVPLTHVRTMDGETFRG